MSYCFLLALIMVEYKIDYYGEYITNYKPSGLTEDIKWRIFYIGQDPTNQGERNMYLISDHYIPRAGLPEKGGVK